MSWYCTQEQQSPQHNPGRCFQSPSQVHFFDVKQTVFSERDNFFFFHVRTYSPRGPRGSSRNANVLSQESRQQMVFKNIPEHNSVQTLHKARGKKAVDPEQPLWLPQPFWRQNFFRKLQKSASRFAAGTANATKPQMGYGDAGGGDGFQMLHIWNFYIIYIYISKCY